MTKHATSLDSARAREIPDCKSPSWNIMAVCTSLYSEDRFELRGSRDQGYQQKSMRSLMYQSKVR